MFNVKKAMAAAALLAAAASASASPITINGVTFDPDAATDFSAQSVNMRQFINPSTGEVSGFGIVTAMDGNFNFCNNCQLTFQFSNLFPVTTNAIPTVDGQTIVYGTGGVVTFYVGAIRVANPADYNSLTWANTATGDAWLSASIHDGFVGTATNVEADNALLSGLGYLDVTGGDAYGNFNTNTQKFGTDLKFTTSLSNVNTIIDGLGAFDISGTGNLKGDTIPEPASIALLGLGLLGAGLARRKPRH